VDTLLKVIQNPKLSGVQQVCCLREAATHHKGRRTFISSGLLDPRSMKTEIFMASQRKELVGKMMETDTLHGRATDAERSIVLGVTMFHAGDNKRLPFTVPLCVVRFVLSFSSGGAVKKLRDVTAFKARKEQ